MILYADTSAIVRAYFPDEPDHAELSELIFGRTAVVVSSELLRVEFAAAVGAAVRAGRFRRHEELLERFDEDCVDGDVLDLLRLDPSAALPRARDLVLNQRVRTLDALHLAVALGIDADEPGEVAVLTRDARQAEAAAALGLPVR